MLHCQPPAKTAEGGLEAVWTKHVTLTLREPGAWGEPGLSIAHHNSPARQPALFSLRRTARTGWPINPLAEPEGGNWRLF